MRAATPLVLLVALTACPLADRVGPYVITGVAAQETVRDGIPADWLEFCNRGDRDLPLKDHALRAVINGVEVVVHTFTEQDVLPAGRRALVGPRSLVVDVAAVLDLPAGPGRVTLRWYDHQRTLVDAFSYELPAGGASVARRRCDCVSRGDAADDTVLVDRDAISPGTAPAEACVDGTSSSSSSSSGGATSGAATSSVMASSSSSSGGANACMVAGCHALFPVTVVGHARTYALEGGGAADAQEVTLLGAGPAAGTFQVRTVSTENGATTTFTPALKILVPSMQAGSTFTQDVTATISATTPVGPVERTVAFSQTVTAAGVETVAGASTLKVVQDATLDGAPQQQVTWYAAGEGVVKQVAPPLPGMTGGARTWLRTACGP